MRIGKLSLYVLSDGRLKVDGGALFGQVPKVLWERLARPDRRNRVRVGLNSLLVQTPDANILIDTGVGTKLDDQFREEYGIGPSTLARNLRNLGLGPKEITHVVLTHLHFDHAGGCTKRNRRGQLVPTFPKATYLVQAAAWDDACSPNERGLGAFLEQDFEVLQERSQLHLLEGDREVVPGVWLKVTNGHCRGHQIALINHGGNKVAFFGDLVPTPHHLTLPFISALDQFPEETLERKRELLALAEREGWLIIFTHGYDQQGGYLERRNGQLHLRPVCLS
ncbi:MAG: MBL fold metallo-hydrolase [Chloroflexi bacterium]|nr:MBL fold metallo-hydrolase [Chloroflexota bacterium]